MLVGVSAVSFSSVYLFTGVVDSVYNIMVFIVLVSIIRASVV